MKGKAHQKYFLKDGTLVPGTTRITGVLNKPALVAWANRIGLQGIEVGKFVDDKADIGTLAHAMITNELVGKETDTSDYSKNQIESAENSVLSYYEWAKGKKIEPILIETRLVSEEHKFGGTVDIYTKIDGVLELLDLKTGSGIYEEHFYQVGGGYLKLLQENGHSVERIRILNIPRTPDESFQEQVIKTEDCEKYWQIFHLCLQLYPLLRKK